ncbi:unnamed protein product [Cyprideis torosa]|uniref:Uncharacterized protein n=1 Tax=Cyprideis torosa TaxID=163714 RepID=A0A7R8ZJV6_9CRUS|nr:unnamed protein product [Cyprideis torosa]CAG0883141.1 unnamed protein product [Cyprideis torosa]
MKCLSLALLLSFGVVAFATESWVPGQEYVYEYKTRTMTGIPSLKTQVSGLGLRSKIVVQVKSPNELVVKMTNIEIARAENQIFSDSWSTWRRELPLSYSPLESSQGLSIPFKVNLNEGQVSGLGLRSKIVVQVKSPNELVVKMTNIEIARAENQIFSDSWSTWRRELPLSYSPLESSQGLSIPFKVNLNEGQVHGIETSETEPIWCVNIKRALASQLSLNVLKISGNHAYVNNEVSKDPEEFYTVEEPSVTGECKTYYTIVPLPDFIARSEGRDLSPTLKNEVGDKSAFMVTKTKDFTFCKEKPAFIHSSVVDENERGSSPADSQHKRQTLVLEKKEPLSNRLPEPSNMVRKSLIFEFVQHFPVGGIYVPRDEKFNTPKPQGNEYLDDEEYRNERPAYPMMNPMWKSRSNSYIEPISPKSLHYPKLTKAPSRVAESGEQVPVQSVIQQIQELLQKVEENLESWEQQSQKEPQIKMLQVARALKRTSVSRYLIRGKLMDKFVVERVWTEGEYIVRPFATNTESIFITSNQTLVLEKKEPLSNRLPEPSNMVRKSLIFEFVQHFPVGGIYVPRDEKFNTPKPQGNEYLNDEEYRNERPAYPMMNPMRKSRSNSYIEPISPKSRHYPKLTKAPSRVAESGEQVPVQSVIQQIQELLQKVEENLESWEQQSQKEPQIKMLQVAHAAAMCGTNPCIMFLKLKIMSREIKGERAAQLIMVFPATVKTPTPDLLRELVQLVKGTKPFEQKQVWYTALLSTATLINRACIDKNTRRHNWAVSPVSERPYCTRKDAEILIPYLKEQLGQTNDTSKLIVLVQAIGNLGIEESYPLLRPIITGKVEVAKQVRVKAIFAVSHLFENSPRSLITQVQSTLMPIFSSPLEPTEVRLAAYVAILKTRPDEAFFTEVATSTWFEPSQHVAQFVTSSLEALANCTFPTHVNISRKAAMALPLAKKFDLGLQYSRHVINSHIIPERRIGSMLTWAHLRGKWSLIPENIYMSLKNHLGGFDVPFFEGSFHSQGTQTLMNRLFGPAKLEGLPSDFVVNAGQDYPTQVNLWMKFMGNMERVITSDILQEWTREGFVEYTSGNEYMVNYQKALPLQDVVIAFPVDSGLPIYVSKKTPLFISIRGSVQFKMDMKQNSMEFPQQAKLKLNLKPLISMSHVIEAGINSPLTKENFISGHKTNIHASLPGQLDIQYRNKEVEIVAERQPDLPSKIELIAIKSTPFTGSWLKMLKQSEPERELRLLKMDQPLIDFAGLYNLLKPHAVLTAIQFVSVPQTLKKIEYNLKLDLSRSETKALKAKIYYNSGVASVHTEVILEGSASRRYRSSIVMSRSPDQTLQKLSVMIERESSASHSHWFLRGNSQFKFPLVPMKRELMLDTHMNALGFVNVKYGTPAKESSLTARFGLRQTKEWRKHVEKSSTFRECSKHEQEGVPFSYTCLKARREAQSLNWMAVQIESHNTPSTLKNLTLHFDDFLKAMYYHHMTNKRFEVQNPTDKVKIVLEIKPVITRGSYPILDVYTYKPKENTFWEGLKISPLAEAFLPLSAKLSSSEKAVNKIMGYPYALMKSAQCGRGGRGGRIIGGRLVQRGEHPSIVSLQIGRRHFCGGTLIGEEWVLTAAHCVNDRYTARTMSVAIREHNVLEPEYPIDAYTVKPSKVIVHERYEKGIDATLANDIALIKLSPPIRLEGDEFAGAACLPKDDSETFTGQNAIAVGWGWAAEDDPNPPPILQQVTLPVISNQECSRLLAGIFKIGRGQICAGFREGGKDACKGDSGGPLYIRKGGIDYLVGITSFGEGCAQPELASPTSPHVRPTSDFSRIINGNKAVPGQFPYQVSLRWVGTNSHLCGGSIIGREWIVSAAHCMFAGKFYVVSGATKLNSGGRRHSVVQIAYDSNYDSREIIYDYAVVRVTPPFEFNDLVQPIKLGTSDPTQLECFASGWGRISQTSDDIPNDLQFVKMNALSDRQCKRAFRSSYPLYNSEAHLCTQTRGANTCNGDSGGPLACMNNGVPELYGITSFGFGGGGIDCMWDLPTGWADAASSYGRKWINTMEFLNSTVSHPSVSAAVALTACGIFQRDGPMPRLATAGSGSMPTATVA